MADAPASNATITGNLPLYKSPEPITFTRHKGKGLKWSDRPFEFLAETHFVPVTLGEFGMAGSDYPIIFMGDQFTPIAAMGLSAGQNLFVDTEKATLEPFAYLPGFIRRYPFVAATHTEEDDRFTVCVDTGSPIFSDAPDEPLFNDDGSPTPFLERAIEFVRRFESDVAATRDFVKRMQELDLFDEQQATFQPRDAQGQPTGDPQVIATYQSISGDKLKKLDANVLAELRDNTYLGAIYAQMLSLSRWETLIGRASVRASKTQGPVSGNAAPPPPPEA
jgi:hypothetical protein